MVCRPKFQLYARVSDQAVTVASLWWLYKAEEARDKLRSHCPIDFWALLLSEEKVADWSVTNDKLLSPPCKIRFWKIWICDVAESPQEVIALSSFVNVLFTGTSPEPRDPRTWRHISVLNSEQWRSCLAAGWMYYDVQRVAWKQEAPSLYCW